MVRKILFISPLPPPHYGSAISSEMCLKILKKNKFFSVRNIKINYSKSAEDIGRLNFSKISGFFKVRSQIKKNLKDFKPEIVYFVPATTSLGLLRDYALIRFIKKNFRKKLIFHIRSRLILSSTNSAIYKRMFKGDYGIALGKELYFELEPFFEKKKILILPNAIKNEISDSEISQANKQRMVKKFGILFLSNMEESKGWKKLLEALKILKSKNLEFKASFVGEWPSKKEENYFINFVKKNSLLNEVSYHGKKLGKEKNIELLNNHLLVFPTEYKLETFGRVIIEAMAASSPVIANPIATIPSIIEDGKTGFLLKENSPQEIAEKITLLINDKEKAIEMGKNGRKIFLKKFEERLYSSKFTKILASL